MIWKPDIGLAVRVFANGPGDLGSIPDRVIPKTQKMVLDASLLNTQHYKVRIKGKVEQSREGVAPSPTPWCSSYQKGNLRVTLDYGRQPYLLMIWKQHASRNQVTYLLYCDQKIQSGIVIIKEKISKIYYSETILRLSAFTVVLIKDWRQRLTALRTPTFDSEIRIIFLDRLLPRQKSWAGPNEFKFVLRLQLMSLN